MNLFQRIKASFSKLSHTFFYRLFAFFIIAVCVPAVCISTLSIKFSANNFIKQESNANTRILQERKNNFERNIKEAEYLTFQLATYQQLLDIFSTKDPYTTYDNASLVNTMLDAIKSGIAQNEMIQSIYIYNRDRNMVFSKSLVRVEDFYDKQVFDIELDGNIYVGVRQATIPAGSVQTKVVSYIRKFDYMMKGGEVIFVVNLKYDKFFNILNVGDSNDSQGFIVFDKNYSTVFAKAYYSDKFTKPFLSEISGGGESSVRDVSGVKYFICKTFSDVSNWNLVFIQPYSDILKTSEKFRNVIVVSFLLIIIVCIFMIYYFSRKLYTPLGILVKETEKYSDTELPGKKYRENEYKIIDEVLKKLSSQKSELLTKYETTLPYFKNSFVNNLLSNSTFDAEKLKNSLELLGVYFIYSKYISLVIDFENSEFTELLRGKLEEFLIQYKEGLIYTISGISSLRIVILINTEFDNELFYSLLINLKNSFDKEDIQLTISTGKQYEDIHDLYLSYSEALRQIENKFFMGKNEIISSFGFKPLNKTFFYDKKLEDAMVECIKSQNREKALNSLEILTEQLLGNSSSIEYIKYVYFQIINNIVCTLEDIGVRSEDTEMSNTFIFGKINGAQTLNDLKQFTGMFIDKSISLLKKSKERKHTDFVNKTIDFIKANYQKDLSLQDIAEKIFLSPRYLNSIFKEETGMTIFDYITQIRMEKAKILINSNNHKIQDIAERVGYNNVQSFIKFFKKYSGMTPTDYRRKV